MLYRAKRVGKAVFSDVAVLYRQMFQGFSVITYVECNMKWHSKCCYCSMD